MNFKLLLAASLLAAGGIASAQTAVQITDPARIAEIERHAQQLGAQPMAAPAPEHMHHGDRMDRKHMHKHRKHEKAMHHHHHKKMPMMKPPAEAAPAPMK